MGVQQANSQHTQVLIVGGGAAGLAVAASLRKRRPTLRLTVVEPSSEHYYQPGWTLVGAGVFDRAETVRSTAGLIPKGVAWLRDAVDVFEPSSSQVHLRSGAVVRYDVLIVAAGLTLDWAAIPGLREALGTRNVTSNYRFDTAPYTWQLVQALRSGRALFTQPPMPIKCAGAPQKAMYLSADHWLRAGRLCDIQVEFHTAGSTLFGVSDYVPALLQYVERYGIDLNFGSTLVAVEAERKVATFRRSRADGETVTQERDFDFLHACPPQRAPDVIRRSTLAGEAGWVQVDNESLQHVAFKNVFALGDVCSAPNAKTAAAARQQAPVVAENVVALFEGRPLPAVYNGYGSCPLTVERGKIVLAEFGYGGRLLPTFPSWLIDGTRPSRLAWYLKERALPPLYWHGMLQGREWLAAPQLHGMS